MKKARSLVSLLIISFFSMLAFAQSNAVNWSAFIGGAGLSNTPSAAIISNSGQTFVGKCIGMASEVNSGFLALRDVVSSINRDNNIIPLCFSLSQNYPNPFNPVTTIRYELPQRANTSLIVYNTLGQTVATLGQGTQEAGVHEVKFDGTGLASGLYFYRLQAGGFVQTKKFLLLR